MSVPHYASLPCSACFAQTRLLCSIRAECGPGPGRPGQGQGVYPSTRGEGKGEPSRQYKGGALSAVRPFGCPAVLETHTFVILWQAPMAAACRSMPPHAIAPDFGSCWWGFEACRNEPNFSWGPRVLVVWASLLFDSTFSCFFHIGDMAFLDFHPVAPRILGGQACIVFILERCCC